MVAQGALDQGPFARAKGNLRRLRLAGRGHFIPGFLHGRDHFVLAGLLRQIRQLMLKKDKAQGVLQYPAVRIARKILLQVQVLHPVNDGVRVAPPRAEHPPPAGRETA